MVQLFRMAVPLPVVNRRLPELPLTVVLVMVSVALAPSLYTPPPKSIVAGDGALVESGRAVRVVQAAAGVAVSFR